MKIFKNLAFALLVFFAAGLISCGKDEPGDSQTAQEITVEALTGTWNLNASSSTLGEGLNTNSITAVTIFANGFELEGDITSVVDGGSFFVDENGAITDTDVDITSADLELDGAVTITLNSAMNQLTVKFTTAVKANRVSGTGSFNMVFDKAS